LIFGRISGFIELIFVYGEVLGSFGLLLMCNLSCQGSVTSCGSSSSKIMAQGTF